MWPEAGSGPGQDGVDAAEELDDDHQEQGGEDVGGVVAEHGRSLGARLQEPAIHQQAEHQAQQKQSHQHIAWS